MHLTDDLLYQIATGLISAMLTLVGTIVGLTRHIGGKYANDILKLENQQVKYQERTDAKIKELEAAERKCMEEKAILTGRVTVLEHVVTRKTREEE